MTRAITAEYQLFAGEEPPRSELIRPQLEMADIFAVQALVMGYIRLRARSKKNDYDDKKYLMAMLDEAESVDDAENFYNGSQDTYMTCRVHKPLHDQWRMTVRFLHEINTKERASTNVSETYRFDWLRNGNRQAWYEAIRRTDVMIDDSQIDEIQILERHPITSNECEKLQQRMVEVCESVNPLSQQSILVPKMRRH